MFGSKKKEKDINLLPGEEKSSSAGQIKMVSTVVTIGVVASVLLVSAAIFSLNLYEKSTEKTLSDSLKDRDLQWTSLNTKAQQAAALKSKLTQIKGLNTSNQIYIDTLDKVRNTIPTGVSLSDFTFSGQLLSLNIISSDPKALYQYASILSKDGFFENVQVKSLVKDTEDYRMSVDVTVKGKL